MGPKNLKTRKGLLRFVDSDGFVLLRALDAHVGLSWGCLGPKWPVPILGQKTEPKRLRD